MEINHQKIEKEAQRLGIKMVILFGSQAEKKARSDSDYDIAVLTAEKNNISDLKNYNTALFFLSEALAIPDHKLDLTNLNHAGPFLGAEIARIGQLLYGNEDNFATFKASAMREYIATQDLRELEDKLIIKRQRILAEKIYA